MPGLVVFKRRWSIGSDDLVVPAVGLALLNILWVLALSVLLLHVYTTGEDDQTCSDGFLWYPAATIALQAFLLVNHIVIAIHSGRGSVLDDEARKHLPVCLYVRTALLVVEVVWFCSGCVQLSWKYRSKQCQPSDLLYVLTCVVVGTNMVVMFLTLLTIYLSFDSAGRTFHKLQKLRANGVIGGPDAEQTVRRLKLKYREKWMNRVSRGFCCESSSKPDHKMVFKDVAVLFASYLDNLDLVLSDFISGMVLLRSQQRALFTDTVNQSTNDIYQYLSGVPISPRTRFLNLKDGKIESEFTCMVHFAEYAVASYGWQGQYFFYPTTACCQINICGRCKGCPKRSNDIQFRGDNCCQCQYTAITNCSPLDSEDDFIYGNYENESSVPSYYVCIDRRYKKVLLCIRGTMSLSDALIDLQGDSEEIKVEPRQPKWHGHMGMVLAAGNVYSDLMEKKIFESAFARCQSSDYKLLVIGHSLGAGVAAIISFMLREQYPDLYCYSYSPPGGLLSPEAVEESKRFTTAVLVGKDMIPRLGVAQLEFFRSDLLSLLDECNIPKWRILSSGVPLVGRCLKIHEDAELPRARSQDYNPFRSKVHTSVHVPLYPPGRIIHIVKHYPKEGNKCKKPLFQPIWSDNTGLDTLVVSPSMIEDHLPNTVLDAMQQVLEHHGPKKPGKVLTEEERQAILHTDNNSGCADRDSSASDLSWEYTCQMEANAVLQKSAIQNGVSGEELCLPNGRVETPTQWKAAPLASQEDLLSIRKNSPSTSSNRGLAESQDEFQLSRSGSEFLHSSCDLVRDYKGRHDVSSIEPVYSPSSNGGSAVCNGVQEQTTITASTPNSLTVPNEHPYFAHIGSGNQVEYNNTDPMNATSCLYNTSPKKVSTAADYIPSVASQINGSSIHVDLDSQIVVHHS